MNTLTIGVDVSFKTLDVAVAIDSERATTLGRFTNSEAGFKELAAKLEREAQGATIHLIMEPTGGDESPLAQFASERQWLVSLPNPRKVKDWASSKDDGLRPTARMRKSWPAMARRMPYRSGSHFRQRLLNWKRCWLDARTWRTSCSRSAIANRRWQLKRRSRDPSQPAWSSPSAGFSRRLALSRRRSRTRRRAS